MKEGQLVRVTIDLVLPTDCSSKDLKDWIYCSMNSEDEDAIMDGTNPLICYNPEGIRDTLRVEEVI